MTEVFETIRLYHMIEPGMRVLVGVSGGADSVYLLHELNKYRKETPFELMAVHVNHGLRGKESLADAEFVKALCDREGIPCRVENADVRLLSEKEGLSLEEAGRNERYRIFEEIRQEWDAQRIAVAHTRNDQAETVMFNLARGSSLKGLGGMRPVQGAVIRPLLFTFREEIEDTLQKEGISWRTDKSNLSDDFTRNRIRQDLLPLMEKEVNSKSIFHISEAASRLQEVQAYLDRQVDKAAARCIRGDCLLLEPYEKEESLIQQELMKRMLQRGGGGKNIAAVHLGQLCALAEKNCGKSLDLPGGIRAVRENGVLRFVYKEKLLDPQGDDTEETEPIPLPVPGCVHFQDCTVRTELLENTDQIYEQAIQGSTYTKWFSYDTIKDGFQLQLRTRRPGDYLVVNAQGGTRKLKDYLIDQKIPQAQRDRILLIADGSHILWVMGYRISEDVKITRKDKKVIKIQMVEGD